jgi:hypothetical protein
MDDTRVLVEWLELRNDDEAMEAWDSAWASLSSLAARAAWLVAIRLDVLVAAFVAALAPWYTADPVVSWICMSLSAALKWVLNLAQVFDLHE